MHDYPGKESKSGKLNFNISAYRVLYLLLLLVQHRSLSLDNLNEYLLKNSLICRAFNSETITKYINTLRRVGCVIPRSNSKNSFCYELLRNPFPITLPEEDLKIIRKLNTLMAAQPDEELHVNFNELIQKIAWTLTPEQQEQLLFDSDFGATPLPIQRKRALLNRFKKLCKDALMTELEYEAENNTVIKSTCEPERILQQGRKIYLLGNDRANQKKLKIELEKIISVRQLPSKIQPQSKQTTVTFELRGRLSKTYRPYPEEIILIKTENTLTVKSKTDDIQTLCRRLLKYGDHVKIISPAYVRQEMHHKILELVRICETPNIK